LGATDLLVQEAYDSAMKEEHAEKKQKPQGNQKLLS